MKNPNEMSDQLLPCPFCGGEAELSLKSLTWLRKTRIWCTNCKTIQENEEGGLTSEEIRRKGIEKWNTRNLTAGKDEQVSGELTEKIMDSIEPLIDEMSDGIFSPSMAYEKCRTAIRTAIKNAFDKP